MNHSKLSFEPQMVYVPSGPFTMGTSDAQIDSLAQRIDPAKKWREKGYFGREQLQHTLALPDYHSRSTATCSERLWCATLA